MTSSLFSSLRPRWKTAWLALVLICQAVQGHPRRDSRRNAQPDVSTVIETAYDNHELLRSEEWMQNDQWWLQREKRFQNISMIPGSATTARPEQGQRKLSRNDREGSAISASSQSDGTFVFPTDDRTTYQTQRINLESVPTCQGATYCEDVANYPEQLVNYAIRQNDSLQYLASVDVVSNIVQRINEDSPDEVSLCVSDEQIVYPQSAENKRKEWVFVVNQDNFKQGVRVEVCNNEKQQCNVVNGFTEGYTTFCKQKYIYRQLAAMGKDGAVISDMFPFPSSCCCHVKFNGNLLTRMGGRIDERSNQTAASSRRSK